MSLSNTDLINALLGVYDSPHFRHYGQDVTRKSTSQGGSAPSVPSDKVTYLRHLTNAYVAELLLPGVKREEITIATEDRLLKVSVNSKNSSPLVAGHATFGRQWTLGADSDLNNITAKHEDGILTITIPRIQPQKSVRTVSVG
jgi:HSP20 family molecular chaperone IbpA